MSTKFSGFGSLSTIPDASEIVGLSGGSNFRGTKLNFLKEIQAEVDLNTANIVAISNPEFTDESTNYTFVNGDGIPGVRMTTGSAGDKTVNVPAAAAGNLDEERTILKIDSGTSNCIVSGNINGTSQWTLFDQYTGVTIKSNGSTGWDVIKIIGSIESSVVDVVDRSVTTPLLATYYQPSGANLELTVEPGTYKIEVIVPMTMVCGGAGQAAATYQLGTSATPGSALIGAEVITGLVVLLDGTTMTASATGIAAKQVFSSLTTLRLNIVAKSASGAPTITYLSIAGGFATNQIIATRIG